MPTIQSVAESGGLSDVFVLRSAEFLGESDEKPFGPADVAEPIRVFILDYFADELRATLAELFKRLVDVVHGEHDPDVAYTLHRALPLTPHDSRHQAPDNPH